MFKIVNSQGKTYNQRWKYLDKAKTKAQALSHINSFHWFYVLEQDKVLATFKNGKEDKIVATELPAEDNSLVFVNYYMEFGDSDATTTGFVVLPKQTWEEQKQKFNQYLEDKGIDYVTVEHENMEEEVNLEMYEEKPCSQEELETLIKFFGDCPSYRKKEGYLYFHGEFQTLEELMTQ